MVGINIQIVKQSARHMGLLVTDVGRRAISKMLASQRDHLKTLKRLRNKKIPL